MRPELLERLYADPSLHAFAVLDGAVFDDLPAELTRLGTEHHCLYLGALPPEVARVAPWLVMLPKGSAASAWWAARPEAAREGITGLSAAPGAIALRRHLRTLTTALQPGGVTVLFRFYDPVVLNQMMTVLDDAQRAYLFGPLVELWAEPEGGGPPIVHLRRPSTEPPLRGPLRLSVDQMAILDAEAVRRSTVRIARFLEEEFPDVAARHGRARLPELVDAAREAAARYGLRGERDIARWSILALFLGPAFADQPEAQGVLTPLEVNPEAGPRNSEKLEAIMDHLSGT